MNGSFLIKRFTPTNPLTEVKGFPIEIFSENDIPPNEQGEIQATFNGRNVRMRWILTDRFTKYMTLESRKQSFFDPAALNQPFLQNNKIELAMNGLYFLNRAEGGKHSDDVKCVICSGIIYGWDANDKPDAEHKSYYKECPGVVNGNIFSFSFSTPLPCSNREMVPVFEFSQHSENMASASFLIKIFTPINSKNGVEGFPINIFSEKDIPSNEKGEIQATFNGRSVTMQGIVTDRFKKYMTFESRRQSFFDSVALNQPFLQNNKTELARNGLYFLNRAEGGIHPDSAKCVICSGIIYGWEANDKPDVEHKCYYQECQGVINGNIFNFSFSTSLPCNNTEMAPCSEFYQQPENMASANRMNVASNEQSSLACESFNLNQTSAVSVERWAEAQSFITEADRKEYERLLNRYKNWRGSNLTRDNSIKKKLMKMIRYEGGSLSESESNVDSLLKKQSMLQEILVVQKINEGTDLELGQTNTELNDISRQLVEARREARREEDNTKKAYKEREAARGEAFHHGQKPFYPINNVEYQLYGDRVKNCSSNGARMAVGGYGRGYTPERLAESGFYYIGDRQFECCCCEGVLMFGQNDDVFTKHKEHFPRCMLASHFWSTYPEPEPEPEPEPNVEHSRKKMKYCC